MRVSAPAKIILTGEHAVVHGETCLAASTDLRLFVDLDYQDSVGGLELEVVKHPHNPEPILFAFSTNSRQPKQPPQFDSLQSRPLVCVDVLEDSDDCVRVLIPKASMVAMFAQLEQHIPRDLLASALRARDARPSVSERAQSVIHPYCTTDFTTGSEISTPLRWCCEVFVFLTYLAFVHRITADQPSFESVGRLRVTVASQIPMGRGMGSSAALCVSISHALNTLFCPNVPENTVRAMTCAHASVAEYVIHGNPSGVDTAVSCYGGVVAFRPNQQDPERRLETVELADGFEALVVDTCVERQTHLLVANVKKLLQESPTLYTPVVQSLGAISESLVTALHRFSQDKMMSEDLFDMLLSRMDAAHTLLNVLGVGHESLERVRAISFRHGCRGCKLTGAGGGGCALVVPGPNLPPTNISAIVSDLRGAGFRVHSTKLGTQGVRVHLQHDE
eukprot:c15201_g1_i1.p1 GENE.c15201_g1_i1~~c15201_g1_i1.p1  ORF type:complete len:456 (+),score=61.98 c15201_g1_i1:27-1370(+)